MKLTSVVVLAVMSAITWAQNPPTSKEVESVYSDAHALYLDIHQNPELSGHERKRPGNLPSGLESSGMKVRGQVGEPALFAVLKMAFGPTAMFGPDSKALRQKGKQG